MNDPHVEALFYKIEHADSVDYSGSQPVDQEADEFRVKIEDDQVCFELKKHYPTVNSAKDVVDRYARVWELEVLLRDPYQEFKLRYSHPKVVDRRPVPGQITVDAGHVSWSFNMPEPTVTVGKPYPQPPPELTLDPYDDDVDTLAYRWNEYIHGRRDLITVAYFCLTVLEKRAGGRKEKRKKAANVFGISFDDLDSVGEITGTKGGKSFARKTDAVKNELSDKEKRFLERAVCLMIRRLSENALDPTKSLDKVRVANCGL